MNTNEFLTTLAPFAVQLRREGSPMFPSVRLAQNLLETGGKIHAWNNLGGIKVGDGKPNVWWRGGVVNKGTWEVYDGKKVDITAAFRAYDTLYDFYKDQDLLFMNTRYKRVRDAKTPQEQAIALYQCGYATDPQYTGKLMTIIQAYGLTKYDQEVEDEMKALEDLLIRVEKLESRIEKLETLIEAPKWFIKEFGSVDLEGKIHDPRLTEQGWRVLAIGLRVQKDWMGKHHYFS